MTPTGRFRATSCFGWGGTAVQATLRRDTTEQAAVPVTLLCADALVQIYAILRTDDQQAADIENIAGTIDVVVAAPPLACRKVEIL